MLFFFQTGPFEDHSGLRKYQGNTLTCLYVIALAIVTPHWKSYSEISGRGGTEFVLHNLQQWDNVQLCVLTNLIGLSAWVGTDQHTVTMRLWDEWHVCVLTCACECCLKAFRTMQIPSFRLLVLVECPQHAGCSSAKHPAG